MQAHRNAMPQGQSSRSRSSAAKSRAAEPQRMPPGGELVCERSRYIRFGAEDQWDRIFLRSNPKPP